MRDINRIDIIAEKLTKVWKKMPDMRFWQFLLFMLEFAPEKLHGTDTFFWEDNITEKMLDDMLAKFGKEGK